MWRYRVVDEGKMSTSMFGREKTRLSKHTES